MDETNKDKAAEHMREILQGLSGNKPTTLQQLHHDGVELILDHLTEGFVKAFHGFGRRVMAQVQVVETDCDDCGALLSFNIICPVDDFHFVLKEFLKEDSSKKQIQEKIKKGREYNARKGFKIEPATVRIRKAEPKGHNIKID